MRKLIIVCLVIVLGCDSNTDLQNTNFEVGTISGDISYLDLLTNLEVTDNESISIELRSIGDTPVSIPSGVSTMVTGSSFEFGPLNFGTYEISAELIDSTTGVIYRSIGSIDITSEDNFRIVDLTLTPIDQTIILGELLNTANMPVAQADAFLYNDSLALQQFKGLGGFIDSGSTNQLGRDVFSGHIEGEYYLLGRLIVGNDTLFSQTEGLVPTFVTDSEITSVRAIIDFEE